MTVVGSMSLMQLGRLGEQLQVIVGDPRSEPTMQTLTEVVTRPDGSQVTVTTTRGEDESVDDFIARHNAVVAALKQ